MFPAARGGVWLPGADRQFAGRDLPGFGSYKGAGNWHGCPQTEQLNHRRSHRGEGFGLLDKKNVSSPHKNLCIEDCSVTT